MDVILKDKVQNLGYKDDVVTVKPGYGRNYLIPQGLAVLATPSNIKMRDENMRQAAHKAEKVKANAEELANSIGDLTLEISTKAGESGKIFGSITPLQVADALKSKGYEIDRRQVNMPKDIKTLGDYEVELDLHKEVKHTVALKVVAE